ncbi:MAG: leucine-rich repeat protein, partial [Clostridium sp.]|nr:leucine-rich repeat protein [Clostridium sp.]
IGDEAFFNSRILRNVYLSDKLKKIGMETFCWCYMLEYLVMPDSVTDIGEYAFYDSGIKYILGGKNAQYKQQTFLNCKNLTLVQLSDATQYLPKQLFKGCTSLEKLYLPENCLGSEDNELFYDIPENQVTVYGKKDMSEFAKNNNALFENVTEHEHTFVTQTVQEARAYDTGLEVTYCSECHYVSDYREIDAPEQFEKTSDYGILEELVHPPNEPTPSPATPPAVTQTPAVSASPTPKPSASPTPTATPTLIPTISPVMTPAPTKIPTVTVKPTKTPAAAVSSPTPIMTDSPPVVSPTAIPINSTSAMPNGNVSSKPDKEPEPTSGNKTTPNPTDRTTPQPADNASPSPANEPLYTISPTPTSATPRPTSVPGLSEKDKKALIVRINMIELTKYNQPEIVWKKTSVNIGYEIYRAMSKKITWKKIAAGETNSSCRYTDKKAKAGQKYYYKMRLFKKTGGQKYYGKYSNVCMIKTLSIVKPKIKGTTGIYRKMPYVQIELKKYSGIYAEIYIRGKDKKYQKIKLKSSSIKRYNAKFKLKCNNKKAVYYFKVRTIVKRVKKKYYSVYSDCLKVKVKGS